jgi:hypothetical protein
MNYRQKDYLLQQADCGNIAMSTVNKIIDSPNAYGILIKDENILQAYKWLKDHESLFGEKVLLKRWASRGQKYWLELFRQDFCGRESYAYQQDHGGGNLGHMDLESALENMREKIRYFGLDGINLKEVFDINSIEE